MSQFLGIVGTLLLIGAVIGLVSIALGCTVARRARIKQRKQRQDEIEEASTASWLRTLQRLEAENAARRVATRSALLHRRMGHWSL